MPTFLSIGSGPGIGLATAERFAATGFRVVLTGRAHERLEILAEPMRAKGCAVQTAVLDASRSEDVADFVSGLGSREDLEVAHYNAASLRNVSFGAQPVQSLVPDLATNIGGALAMVQAVLPSMTDRQRGTILLTGGGLALYPQPDWISLSIGKAGLRALALGMFEELKRSGIHIGVVNVAAPIAAYSDASRQVAEAFWALHAQAKEEWRPEVMYPQR